MPCPWAAFGRRSFLLVCGAVAASSASAQAAPPPAAAAASAPSPRPVQLAPVVVTGNPLRSAQTALPVTVLEGEELSLRRSSSLGETLNGLPGVSSTYFGPNASRPIIRGLDGDRIRILENGGASFDASSLSFDHAVPIDPLVVEKIEVLRGPAALLYGGNAIGGVVNTIDNRIPKAPLQGVEGGGELRLGGAERERSGSALVEAGDGRFAVHADGFWRVTSDQLVPRYAPVEADGSVLDRTKHVRNSDSNARGGAGGASWTFGSGYLGVSAETYDNHYGVTAEEGTVIRMKRDRYALAGELRDLSGPLRAIRVNASNTRYHHEEVEDTGEVGTTFRTRGTDLRIEAEHAALGPVKGVVGVQLENFGFSALGEEAFVPTTHTHKKALFVLEEWASPVGKLSAGVRVERARVASDGDAGDVVEPRFGGRQGRRFTTTSASLGDVVAIDANWSLVGSVATTARSPTSFELYADGVHAATGAFEVGDPTLRKERGTNVDLALQWTSGHSKARLGVFASRFSRYLSLEATGSTVTEIGDDGQAEAFPEYAFRSVEASFRGVEFEASHRLLDAGWSLDLTGKVDYTRAANRSTGEPLPRIAPLRATLGLDARTGPWLGRVEVDAAARQNRVPSTDTETGGYAILNAALTRRLTIFRSDALAFVKLTNLTDKLGYSAATIETIRGLVPLPGRAVRVGLRVDF